MDARHALTTAVALSLCVLAPRTAQGQESRWSVEGRLGSAIPTGDLTNGALNQTAGMSLSADLMYTVDTNLTVFGGFGHQSFDCDGCNADVSTTGLDGGIKYLFGAERKAMPWMRAGLMVHRPEFAESEGDWNPGLDSGVGIDWALSDQFTLVPALRYNTYEADDLTLSYFTIDLGGHLHFGG